MEVALILLALALILVGVAGCILPVLPGPPIAYAGMIVLWGARGWEAEAFGWITVLVVGLATVVVTIIDTIAPALGARRYGASKLGFWGSVVGMLVGIFALPPFGMVVGAFLGALIGEVLAGKTGLPALRAAWGVLVGTMAGILLKLVVSFVILFYWLVEVV